MISCRASIPLALVIVVSIGSLGSVGCGGGRLDCSKGFTACGGDITGTWKTQGLCGVMTIAMQSMSQSCPTATLNAQIDVGGSFEFRTDHSYDASLTEQAKFQTTLPAACLPKAMTSTATCHDVGTSLMRGNVDIMSATCNGTMSFGCSCTVTENPVDYSETGTYGTAGTTLTLTQQNGNASDLFTESPYCVNGKMLTVRDPDPTMSALYLVLGR
jgi:hypothetical protein